MIKRALLDQQLVSGIGNIYADEALWAARMHYARPTSKMSRAQATAVISAAATVMRSALTDGGTSFDALYVNVVATLPEARGRGLGRLVTLAALRDARERGAGAAVLESSQMGYALYGRLGFQDVGRYRLLVRARSVGG